MSAKGKLSVIIECLKERPLTTTEIKDVVNTSTKYGASGSELRAFLNRRKDVFEKVGQEYVSRDCGSYTVDLWWLKELIMETKKEATKEKAEVKKVKKGKKEATKGKTKQVRFREPWSDAMWLTFLNLFLKDKMMQVDIAKTMDMRLTQIHGAAKRYRKGEADKYVTNCSLCNGVAIMADDYFVCAVCGADKRLDDK